MLRAGPRSSMTTFRAVRVMISFATTIPAQPLPMMTTSVGLRRFNAVSASGFARTLLYRLAGLTCPILNFETRDAFGFTSVIGDKLELEATRVGRDQQVISSDHDATCLSVRP